MELEIDHYFKKKKNKKKKKHIKDAVHGHQKKQQRIKKSRKKQRMQKQQLLTQPHRDMSFNKSIQQAKLDKESRKKIALWRQIDLDLVVQKRSELNKMWIKRAPHRAEILHNLNMQSNELAKEKNIMFSENDILAVKSCEISDRIAQIDANKHMIIQLKSEIDNLERKRKQEEMLLRVDKIWMIQRKIITQHKHITYNDNMNDLNCLYSEFELENTRHLETLNMYDVEINRLRDLVI